MVPELIFRGIVTLCGVAGVAATMTGLRAAPLASSDSVIWTIWFLLLTFVSVAPRRLLVFERRDWWFALSLFGGPGAALKLWNHPRAEMACTSCLVGDICALATLMIALVAPVSANRHPFRVRLRQMSPIGGAALVVGLAVCVVTPLSAMDGIALNRWIAGQKRFSDLDGRQSKIVRVVVFTDYQCPVCLARHKDFDQTIREIASRHPGRVAFDTLDYPLDSECNSYVGGAIHPAACEAAVAVRIAPDQERRSVQEALFLRQVDLTPASVSDLMSSIHLFERYEEQYSVAIAAIRRDIDLAASAGVRGTPAYFVNGLRVDGLSTATLARVIEAEIGR